VDASGFGDRGETPQALNMRTPAETFALAA
jgi:hypothetical protein